ncbi:hypothetical protein GPECTOR_6g812 [Gonium pectorale]|uniref:Uncharacterized protein n=1 Tax=Gonium pectorale TaxID=33097 RepID=A0A150GVR8_GONPE|nr:hypothetical protein GPECTOR_6g812 [Gonium pectorale]|eukprot:KXZ53894.1 hypothetical protein GPECTOR_6g812 [Gonium pectorale]
MQQSTLVLQQLSSKALAALYAEPATLGGNLESLGALLMVLVVVVAAHFTLGPLVNLWQDALLWCLGAVTAGLAVWQLLLLQADGKPGRLLSGDKLYVLMVGALAAAVAYGILTAAPRGWLRDEWDATTAARDLDRLFNGGIRRLYAVRMQRYIPPPPMHSDPQAVAVVLAAVAGAMAAGLLGSSARVARLYSYVSPPPHWGERYLAPGPLSAAILRLALALPLAVVLFGIRPAVDFWGPAASAAAAGAVLGPALVAAAAAAQLLAVRPLVGSHLGSALLEYHLVRHSVTHGSSAGAAVTATTPAAAAMRDELLRKRLHFVYATAALQLLSSAIILVCLAIMYGAAAGTLNPLWPAKPFLFDIHARRVPAVPPVSEPGLLPVTAPQPPAAPEAAPDPGLLLEGMEEVASVAATLVHTAAAAASGAATAASEAAAAAGALPPMPPLDFLRTACGFLAWWCCVAQCLFTYSLLFVYRTGLHVG